MIRPNIWNNAVNRYWRMRSQTDDEFYFGLADRIQQRQEGKIPTAGEGAIQFLQLAGTVTSGVAILLPPFRPLVKLIGFAERTAREKTQSTE